MNTDPYLAGWILKLQPSKPEEFGGLMSAEAYARFVEEGPGH